MNSKIFVKAFLFRLRLISFFLSELNNILSRLSDVSFLQGSVPLLRVLDLGLNLIEDIPYGALRGYPTLEKLALGWNQISGLAKVFSCFNQYISCDNSIFWSS